MIHKAKEKQEYPYIRVGTDYFKLIERADQNRIFRKELVRWTKEEIKLDHGSKILFEIPKYDAFCCVPDHKKFRQIIENCYNNYYPFEHKPAKGSIKWTFRLLRHIFENQINLGLDYIQLLYENPVQILPILCLVSYENGTGKTTFLNWLFELFRNNVSIIGNQELENRFNGLYAHKLIIAVDESKIDKSKVLEKIKSLATAKTVTVDNKYVTPYTVDFFGKIILCSNYEDNFINAKDEDIRYWIRKLEKPKFKNFNIEDDLKNEIPAFLHYLQNRELHIKEKQSRMWFNPDDICTNELKVVREHSRSWLYKELAEALENFFLNDGAGYEFIEAVPEDLKYRFFSNNNKVETNYVRRVLKNEYKLKPQDVKKYYCMGNGEYKLGRPFRIDRYIFVEGYKMENEAYASKSIENTNELPY